MDNLDNYGLKMKNFSLNYPEYFRFSEIDSIGI